MGPASPPQRRGRPPGHSGTTWCLPAGAAAAVEQVELPLVRCPRCGGRVRRRGDWQDHVVLDLPPLAAVFRNFRHERGYCPRCRQTVRAPAAADEPPHGHLGMRLLALVASLKSQAGMSYAKIQALLQEFQVPVSRAALVHSVRRVAEWLQPRYAALRQQVRAAPVVYADETGWPVDGKNGWMWAFTTGPATLYAAEPTRARTVAAAVLGEDQEGVLVTDFYAVYESLRREHQYCWAHLLREAKEVAAVGGPVARRLHQTLARIFHDATVLQERLPLGRPAVQYRAMHGIHRRLSRLRQGASRNPDVERLKQRIARTQEGLLTFLWRPEIAPTANLGERKIRPVVVARKLNGGSRSWSGARAHAVLMSCLQSLDHFRVSFLDLLRGAAGPPHLRPALGSVLD
ncbi:MAG: IS66 family transposase [Candidatus Rokuibacteriota bacterium]